MSSDNPWNRRKPRRDPDDDDRDRDRDDYDDDYDDRPRRRRRRRESTGSNGLAVAGLVLGILSLFGGLALTGVPAIILSVMAMQKPAGKGMAVVGLITGTLGTLATIAAVALLLPAVQKIRDAAGRAKDMNNLKGIGLAAQRHADA